MQVLFNLRGLFSRWEVIRNYIKRQQQIQRAAQEAVDESNSRLEKATVCQRPAEISAGKVCRESKLFLRFHDVSNLPGVKQTGQPSFVEILSVDVDIDGSFKQGCKNPVN